MLGVVGYVAALMTAFYAFRMVFRVFFGEPVDGGARARAAAHLAHREPANPATGESEDTDVGFPGPEHHIAEREWPMKAAMAPLALLSIIGGVVGIPGVTDTLEHFLEPTFEDSGYLEDHPSESAEWTGLVIGGADRAHRHRRSPGSCTCAGPALTLRLRDRRLRSCTTSSRTSGTSTSSTTSCSCGRCAAFGRFGRTVIESVFVQDVIIGGAVGRRARRLVVRARAPDRLPARLRRSCSSPGSPASASTS